MVSPAAANTIGAAPVVFTGTYAVTDSVSKTTALYSVSLTGSVLLPPTSPAEFSLTGTGVFDAYQSHWNPSTTNLGVAPSFSLTGQITDFDSRTLNLQGYVGPSSSNQVMDMVTFSAPGIPAGPPPPAAPFSRSFTASTMAPLASSSAKGSSSTASGAASSAPGASFGSLISFAVVKGANGGPNWSFCQIQGRRRDQPAGERHAHAHRQPDHQLRAVVSKAGPLKPTPETRHEAE